LPAIQNRNLAGALLRCASGSRLCAIPQDSWPQAMRIHVMDILFILIIVALYAGTHWLIWALSRLGGVE
jgi:hypothetical protein